MDNKLSARKGLLSLKCGGIGVKVKETVGLILHVLVDSNHEAKRTACGIVASFPCLRFHQTGHHTDEYTGREILSHTRLFLVEAFLQQPFIQVAQPLLTGKVPVDVINGGDDLLQILRLINVGGRTLMNLTDTAYTDIAQIA